MITTNTDKLHCIQRELVYRRRVYKRLVANDKMSFEKAKREIEIMEDIERDYHRLVDADEPLLAVVQQ
jgi:hypothetical protein